MLFRRKTFAERLKMARIARRLTHIAAIVDAIRVIRDDHERFPREPVDFDRKMQWTWSKDLYVRDVHIQLIVQIRADLIVIKRGDAVLMTYVDQHHQYGGMLGTNDMQYSPYLGKVAKGLAALLAKD